MNASIICKQDVKDSVLEVLSKELPGILAGVLDVPGGSLARLNPEQVSLEFSRASLHDVGSDIRIMAYARRNAPRASTERERAKSILDRVVNVILTTGNEYSVNVRLYLMEIGAAEHSLSS
jgi:hypothetical protein